MLLLCVTYEPSYITDNTQHSLTIIFWFDEQNELD